MIVPFHCPACAKEVRVSLAEHQQEVVCPACGKPARAPVAMVAPGVVLGSGFRIERRLRDSSVGELYLAQQETMSRQVLVKILPRDEAGDAENLQRFRQEVRIAASLAHPNLLSAIDAGEECGIHYLVTQYREGDTLADYLKARGPQPEAVAAKLLLPIAQVLKYAWEEHRLVHRNVKPLNIVVPREGTPLLTDLGIAKLADMNATSLTAAGFTIGTPDYMSPEQCRAEESVDYRTDMYALGIVFYELMVGQTPFGDRSPVLVMQRHLDEPPPALTTACPGASPAAAELVAQLLAKDKNARPMVWDDVILKLRALSSAKAAAGAAHKAGQSKSPPLVRPGSLSASGVRSAPTAAAPPPRGPVFYVGTLVVVIVVMAALYYVVRGGSAPATPPGPAVPPVAVAPLVPATVPPVVVPPVVPPPAVVPPGSSTPAAADGLDGMYQLAKTYLDTHPGDYAEALRKLDSVRSAGKGTKYVLLVDDEQKRLRDLYAAAVQQAQDALAQRAAPLVKEDKLAAAAALYETYTGPYAAETKDQRLAAAKALRDRLAAQSASDRARFAALRERVAALLLAGKTATVVDVLTPAQAQPEFQPWQAELKELRAIAEAAGKENDLILASFTKDVNQEITVKLTKADDTFTLSDVKGTTLIGYRVVQQGDVKGKLGVRYDLSDITSDERLKRLEGWASPLAPYLCAIVARRAGNGPKALSYLEKLDTDTAEAFRKGM